MYISVYEMVVLGQWPYQHTITLDQLRRQSNVSIYYLIDEDRTIPHSHAIHYQKQGYILDDEYLTVRSETMNSYLSAFLKQSFPPAIHMSVSDLLSKNENEKYREILDKMSNSGAILLVNDQDRDIMKDLGAEWNSSLSLWILDAITLRTLREKRRQKTNGKVEMRQDKGGVLVEIYGDVTPHTNLLREVGGKYDEDKDIWYIQMSLVHKIMHILS